MSNSTFTNDRAVDFINIIDVDAAFYAWWNEKLNVHLVNNQGFKEKIPLLFVAPERWEVARREGIRDENGVTKLPLIAVSRSAMSISNDLPTSRHFADTKEHVVYHKEVDPKSSILAEAVRKQREAGNDIVLDKKTPIYQVYTRTAPDHYSITYQVKIWTPYIEHMNQFIQKMAQAFDYLSVKSFAFKTKAGYYLVAFQSDEIEDDSNTADYSDDERIIRKTFSFTVGAYIHAENDEKKGPFRKYFTQSKIVFKTKVMDRLPLIDPADLIDPEDE